MSVLSSISNFSREFIRSLFAEAKSVLSSVCEIEMVSEDASQLVLQSSDRNTVINKRHRTVKTGTELLARFDEIKFIDITRHLNDNGSDSWSVSLSLSWFSSVNIGRTTDDTNASIVAARIGTITGKKFVTSRHKKCGHAILQ